MTVELAQNVHPEGYKRVKLSAVNKDSPTPVHRLVALAFHPNPLGLPQVNHINGDKGHNHAENLEWVSNAENQRHASRTGLHETKRGADHNMAVLTDEQVRAIRQELSKSSYRGQLAEVGRRFGVSKHCIFDIKRGRSWSHVE